MFFVFFIFSIYRHGPCRDPINPYYVNTGHVLAPTSSANDSEQQSMSSDAETISLTDSSVYVYCHHTLKHIFNSCYIMASLNTDWFSGFKNKMIIWIVLKTYNEINTIKWLLGWKIRVSKKYNV